MTKPDDPFLPKGEPEMSLEIDDGFAGSGRKTHARGLERTNTTSADAFAPAPVADVALDLDTGYQTSRSKRATLSQHKDFIDATKQRMTGGKSFAEKQADTSRLYWRLTRIPILLVLSWFTVSHLAFDAKWVFIDNVNLVFHEAGHPMFRWGGDTLYFLGGTLGQLLWPALMAGYFFFARGERFAAAACLWWLGENFIGIARYMHDAPVQELPLVGGDTHDWDHLFTKWDMMAKARDVADIVRMAGVVVMLATLAYLLWVSLRPTVDELAEGFRA